MKKLLTLFIFFLIISSVQGLYIEQNTTFADDNYWYKVQNDLNISSIRITTDDLYIDGIPFCDSIYRTDLISLRECYVPPSGGGGGGTDLPEDEEEDEEEQPINETEIPIIEQPINETEIPIINIPINKDRTLRINLINLIIVITILLSVITIATWWLIIWFKKRRKKNEKDEFGLDWVE